MNLCGSRIVEQFEVSGSFWLCMEEVFESVDPGSRHFVYE